MCTSKLSVYKDILCQAVNQYGQHINIHDQRAPFILEIYQKIRSSHPSLLHALRRQDMVSSSVLPALCEFSQWRHNERDGVSNHQPHDCLLNCLFRLRWKKTSKLRVTGLCAGNSPVTDEFPAQRASNAKNVSIWWRHHVTRTVKIKAPRACSTVISAKHEFIQLEIHFHSRVCHLVPVIRTTILVPYHFSNVTVTNLTIGWRQWPPIFKRAKMTYTFF